MTYVAFLLSILMHGSHRSFSYCYFSYMTLICALQRMKKPFALIENSQSAMGIWQMHGRSKYVSEFSGASFVYICLSIMSKCSMHFFLFTGKGEY